MNPNDQSSPFRPRGPKKPWHELPPQPLVREDTLKANEVQIERKSFVFLLKENPRGRFLRIIEQGGKNSASIIIPTDGLNEFNHLLAEMLEVAQKIPPKLS